MNRFGILAFLLLLATLAVCCVSCTDTPSETTAVQTTVTTSEVSPMSTTTAANTTTANTTTANTTTAATTTTTVTVPATSPENPVVQKTPADVEVFVFDGMLDGYRIAYDDAGFEAAMALVNELGLEAVEYEDGMDKVIYIGVKTDGIVPLSGTDYHMYMSGKNILILGGSDEGCMAGMETFAATLSGKKTSLSQYVHTVFSTNIPPKVETVNNYTNLTQLIGNTTKNPLSYSFGDEIVFVLKLTLNGQLVGCNTFSYTLEADDTKQKLSGTVSGETGYLVSTVPQGMTLVPGSVRLSVNAYDASNQLLPVVYGSTEGQAISRPTYSFIGGAVVEANSIYSDVLAPDDFAEFWTEMLSTTIDPTISSSGSSKYRNGFAIYKMDANYLKTLGYESYIDKLDSFDFYEIYLACDADRIDGRPAVGYVTVPKNAKPNSLPIVVGLNAYGTRDGYFSCSASSITVKMHPNGMPKAYYNYDDGTFTPTDFSQDANFAKFVADYDDPATAYLTKMILRNIQMLHYLTSDLYEDAEPYDTNITDFTDFYKMRAAYNGKISFAYGGSMGGFQNIATAALCSLAKGSDREVEGTITSIVVGCPWMCDPAAVAGATGRLMGLGTRIGSVGGDSLADLDLVGLSYFDTVHFGALLTEGKLEIQAGFADTTCPSSGIVALYNAVTIEKTLIITQNKDHSGKNPVTMNTTTVKEAAQ